MKCHQISSVLALTEMHNDAIGIELLDLVRYFDREALVDAMDELHKSKVEGKLYKLVFEMNRKTNIKVRNAVGESDAKETTENICQGSIDGAIISSNNLSGGVEDYFSSSSSDHHYVSLRLLPQQYQGGLFCFVKNPVAAMEGNVRFESLANAKLLEYNWKKSSIIILGKKKEREKLEEDFRENPPLLNGKPMKIESQGTYLGEEFGKSLTKSITLTINKRIGIAKKSIFDIKHIIEDCRSGAIGSISTGILLWESCIASFLFNNASTWLEISSSDLKRLSKIQNLFLNMLLAVYKCPAVLMYWDLKMLVVPLRILKLKVMLYHHILSLSPRALSSKILHIQQDFHLPGLNLEVQSFLAKHQLFDIMSYSKGEWKLLVDRKIHSDNREFLIEWSKKYKKVDTLDLECENYELKRYFLELDLASSRLKFRERSGCLLTCRTAFPSDLENIRVSFKCFHCPFLDTGPSHWVNCIHYKQIIISKKLNIGLQDELLTFYREVIKMRTQEI